MSGNATFTLSDTAILAIESEHAPEVVPSSRFDDRLIPTYDRLGMRGGVLESLAGIAERRWWPEGFSFTDAAAKAGAKALAASGIDPSKIGLLIDTSVCRDRLEPSAAVTVHNALGLPSATINFDLANACLGFLNAMHLAGNMLDNHQIDYALIVDGEGSREVQEATLDRLSGPDATVEDLFAEFATLTLGSGAAAMVLGRKSEHPEGHSIVRGVTRNDTNHHQLCVGDLEQMRTDTKALLDAGLELCKDAWTEADFGWEDMDRYVMHQVSAVHTHSLCELLGINPKLAPLTFPTLGNIGPASVPLTLADEAEHLQAGDKVLCMGIGSGINTSFIEILW